MLEIKEEMLEIKEEMLEMLEIKQEILEEKTTKKKRFFEIYISKVLKQLSNSKGITSNSKQQLNSIICILAKTISNISMKLSEISGKKTISDSVISNAVTILFSGNLCKNAIIEAQKAVEKFNIISPTKGNTRNTKAGIIFPPSISENFLRNFGYSKIMITNTAPVFLATILEYFLIEILLLSCRITNKTRITIRDLQLSVYNDVELSLLFNKLNISFLGGGVIPYIHPTLMIKKKTDKISNFRTITEMKKIQNNDCLVFSKLPFEKLVRDIVNKSNPKMKISKDVFIILQYFIEQYIVSILRDSNDLSIYCGRVKLIKSDIEFICKIKNIEVNNI